MSNPFFIAEVSSNHHGDLNRSLRFIDVAAEVGCDAVKFQLFKVDQLFAPEILQRSEQHRARKKWELPEEFLPILAKHAEKKGIQFSCTPFYMDAVKILEPYVDFYKIASYELLWKDMISACAATGKRLILSTGMADLDEVVSAVDNARHSGAEDLTVLHCVSGYPTPPEQCNLAAIKTIRDACGCDAGWSDHSVSPAVVHRAVNHWDAGVVEFHLDLDGQGDEFAPGHCWLPDQIERVISDLKAGPLADGAGVKTAVEAERSDRAWRADPGDGLRPMKEVREAWSKAE